MIRNQQMRGAPRYARLATLVLAALLSGAVVAAEGSSDAANQMAEQERIQREAIQQQEESIRRLDETRQRLENSSREMAAQSEARRLESEGRRQMAEQERTQREALRSQEQSIRRLEETRQRLEDSSREMAAQSAQQARDYSNVYPYPYPSLSGGQSSVPLSSAVQTGNTSVSGLEFATISDRLGAYFGVDTGVLVVRASALSPFTLQDGDVILLIDGRAPTNAEHAARILNSYQPGEKVKLRVQRDRRAVELDTVAPGGRSN
jgi:uncharacterized protein (UPF0303 family)